MKNIKFLLILLIMITGNLSATNYYVDSDGGHDTSSGKSITLAWKSIEKINSYSHFNDGDIISFKCGVRWIGETLIPPINYLTFNSYSFGDRPVIDALGAGNCVNFESKSNITFTGLKFVNGTLANINMWDCSHITFESCNIDSAYNVLGHADYDPGSTTMNLYSGVGSNLIVRNCTMSYAGGSHGIYIDGTDNTLLEFDTLMYNAHDGIRIGFGNDSDWTDNLTIRYCVSKFNKYAQLEEDGARNSSIYYNVFEMDPGYYTGNNTLLQIHQDLKFHCPQSNVYYLNNTLIGHNSGPNDVYSVELKSTSGMQNIVFKNNIFYYDSNVKYGLYLENWHQTIDDIEVYGGLGNFVFTNNLYYTAGATNLLFHSDFTSQDYSTINAWNSATGYEENSIYADPLFNNYNTGDYSLPNNSSSALSGVWVGLNSPDDRDILGTKIGNPPDIGAYQKSTYWAGTISANDTMRGNVAITDSITVAQSCTLTVAGGTHIKVENGSNIRINGTLQCDYDSEKGNITIDTILTNNQKGSIIFDGSSSSNSVLQFVSMRQGGGIQCLNGANVQIKYSRLDSCTQGIYIYHAAPQIINDTIYDPTENAISGIALNASPLIRGNVLTKVTEQYSWEGIYLINGSYPYVMNNDINGFGYGIYIGGGSTCWFHDPNYLTPIINNRFRNNSCGICSGWGSIIAAGDTITAHHGDFNTIFDNETDCESYEYSALYARHNYWSDDINSPDKFYVDETSLLDLANPLDFDPWDMLNSDKNKQGGHLTSINHLGKSVGGDDLLTGLQLELDGKIDDAITFYKNLISEDKFVRIALSHLAHIKYKYGKNELANYFGSLLTGNQKNYSTLKNVIGGMYLQNNQFDNAMAAYDNIIHNYPTDYDGISARFSKLFAYLHIKKDPTTASRLLSEIKGLNSDEKEVQMNIKIAESLLSGYNKVLGKKTILSNDNIPKTYNLSQNFPNPFNPATTIRYQIPKPGLVTLKVYDILGREVVTLVNENKIEGSYDFTFNASRFASGVYIYQLIVNDYVASKKMLLLK